MIDLDQGNNKSFAPVKVDVESPQLLATTPYGNNAALFQSNVGEFRKLPLKVTFRGAGLGV